MRKNVLLLAAMGMIAFTNLDAKNTDIKNEAFTWQNQKETKIVGEGKKQTIQVKAGDIVKIMGKNHQIVIEGTFSSLEIDGVNNKITLQRVDQVNIEGADNTVNASAVNSVYLKGISNQVQYKSSTNKNGKANVESQGKNNRVKKIN